MLSLTSLQTVILTCQDGGFCTGNHDSNSHTFRHLAGRSRTCAVCHSAAVGFSTRIYEVSCMHTCSLKYIFILCATSECPSVLHQSTFATLLLAIFFAFILLVWLPSPKELAMTRDLSSETPTKVLIAIKTLKR